MRILTLILGLTIMAIAAGCNAEKEAVKPDAMKPIDEKNMDLSVQPGHDFFVYANGGWMKNNPIPPEHSKYAAFTQLYEENLEKIKILFENVAKTKNAKKGAVEQLIGDYYYAGMNEEHIEKLGYQPIKPWLDAIENLSTRENLLWAFIDMHLSGLNPLFSFYAGQDDKNSNMVIANFYQGGIGLGNRDYYFNDDERSKLIRSEYQKHIKNSFKLIGYSDDDAAKASKTIYEFEKKLADKSRTNVALRDPQTNYNKMNLNELNKLAPGIDWASYFQGMQVSKTDELNIGQPEFIQRAAELFAKDDLNTWKLYFKWNIVRASSDYLSSAFVNEHFNFYGKVLSGTEVLQDRWKRVLNSTSGDLGEAVGKLYIKEYFPPEAKKKMLDLVKNLRIALEARINNLEWMGEATKKEAVAKLNKMNVKIGYPDKWVDYSSIDISRDNFFQNTINCSKFEVARRLEKIGKGPDREEWHMTPQTVNAYYSPNMNEIVFPAAILQAPFFDLNADDAVNYAAIGTVIGHEMTHGFDDQGRQFDKDGNLKDWWTKEDAEKFTARVQILVAQYNEFVAIDTMHVNGELTLGENIADVGGVTVSYDAWLLANGGKMPTEKIDGYTPQQRFFLSYAQIWRNNTRDEEMMNRIKNDVHSPGRFRVNGVVPNINQYYEAFNIKESDPMYIPEENRAKIW